MLLVNGIEMWSLIVPGYAGGAWPLLAFIPAPDGKPVAPITLEGMLSWSEDVTHVAALDRTPTTHTHVAAAGVGAGAAAQG